MKILSELKDYAINNNVPIMQEETVEFLLAFIKEKEIQSILEIGTAIGYSALQMSQISSVQRIVSLESNYGYAQIADANIHRADKSAIIEVINQDALKFSTEEHFDLLFIDGPKAQYQKFFDRFIDKVDYVFVDNLDFHGIVDNPSLTTNRHTRQLVKKLTRFKENILEDEEYNSYYRKIGDGILIVSKRQMKG